MMMKFSFILFAIFHLSLQNSSQEQDQQNLQVNQQRKLQSCSSTCSECDESGFCLKCSNQRVLPSCDCQIGYYDFQGTCQPCKKGCMSCTSGNDCQQCYLTYNLDVTNQICTCNISNMVDDCEKPKQGFLLQYSRYMSDFRSIELVFNEMINIVGKELYEQFNPLSSTNCDILDSQTKSIYLNSVFTCFIDSLQRNRFIITFSSLSDQLDKQLFFSHPVIDVNKITIQIKQNQIPVKKIFYLEDKVKVQHNQRPKICYFMNRNFLYNHQKDPEINKLQYFDIHFKNMVQNRKASVISPYQQTGNQLFFSDESVYYQSLPNNNYEGPIIISLECSLFDIQSVDTITVQITLTRKSAFQIYTSKFIGPQNFIQGSLDHQVLQSFIFKNLQNYQLRIKTIPQIFDTIVIPLTQQMVSCTTTIPAFSAKYTQVIQIMQEVIDLAGTTVSQQNIVYLNYNIQRVPDLDNQMNNINPQNDLWIEIDKTQILLAESRNIDSKFVSQSWFCVDKNDEPCMNANQQPLQILQLGNKMRVKKNQLLLNTQYFFFYQLQSIKYQFSQQFQKFSVDTGQTYAYADIQGQQTGGIINVQDFISISIFIHTDFPYQIKQALYKLNLEQNGLIKTLTSNSNQFSFQIQDYFPNPNFAQKPAILSIDYSVYDYFSKQTIFMQDPSNPTTLEISPPDMINIEIKSQQYVEFVDQIKIQCNSINSKTVQFFYYNSAEDREFELQNPYQTTRKLLSLDQTDQEVTTYLPSGDIIIMVLGFNEQIYQYSNITQVLTVNNNHFTQEQYIIFIQKQWSLAQQFKQQTQITKEIFIYQNMIEAIEQFEKKYQTTNQVIDQVKTDILLRLQESVWQNQIDQIFNLSGEITLRIVKTQIELDDSDMFNLIVSSTVNRIQKLCHSAQQISSYFNQKLKFQYQESFRITIQTYMALIKINEKMHQIDEESIIQNTFDAMTGMSQLLIINQSLVQLMTSSASVQVEKYDDVKFMNNYIQQQSNIDKDSFLNLNQFLVLTQTWPNNTSLYREELKQYNQKYLALANSTTLSQLLTTYSIKIPKVITINYRTNQDQRRRFLEDTKISNQQNNFVINFSNLTQNQNLECIQRNNKGKWVSSSCKTNIIIKNNQTQVDCICQIPDATSIIADAEALLQNENLSEIFSERGAVGVFKLQNWYEYIAIWTIIVLNIFYACLACVTRKFDKRDRAKLSNLQKQTDEEQNLFYQRSKKKEKVFIFIKARKSTFIKPQDYQQSENNSKEKSLLQEQKQNKSSDIKQIDLAEVKKIKIQDKAILSIQSLRHIENNQITSNQNVCQKPHSDKINTEKQTAPSLNIQNDSYFKQIQCNFTTKEDEQIKNQIEIHHQPGDEKQSLSQLLELKQENNQNNQQCEQRNQENIKEIQQSFQQQYHQQDARQSPKNKTQHNLADESFSQPQIKENQQQQNDIEKQSSEQIKYKDEKMKKEEKRKLKKAKKELAKQKMIEYLNQEKIIYGILSFHQLFSIFLIYYENQSRVLRSSIFYNKMVWLLTLNSIFGQNLTVAQIFILSIVSSIVLQIVTNIISLFLRYKNFQKIGVFFVFAFCLFCYYSILVTISRSSVYESNIWVISYFATLIINEFVFGIIKCIAQYFTCKKILQKTQSKYLLRMLGANLLLKSFSI